MSIHEILKSINEDTFVISDTHLGHKSILQFEPCRLTAMRIDGYDNHEEWVIDNWNSVVGPDDIVLCLGDFAFGRVAEYSKRLNGNKIIVLGNHDDKPHKQKWKDGGWTVIDGFYMYDMMMTCKVINDDPMMSGFTKTINGKRYMFSHYPVFDSDEWDRKNQMIAPRIDFLEKVFTSQSMDYSVHGHIHSNVCAFENSINVSFEHLDFKPKKLGDLI
jgi:calcineurin-like phosphoesterase family protein